MILPITTLPSQVLRKPVQDLTFPLKKDIKRLISDMLETVKGADGIGLAGPQVGRDLNLAIVYLVEVGLPPFVMINPKITKSSKTQVSVEEGCLSMPGVFGQVKRPKSVTVEFFDQDGVKHEIADDGWLARVMQHEIDHLKQTLIIDKLDTVNQGKNLLDSYKEPN